MTEAAKYTVEGADDDSSERGGDENVERGNWSGKFDFILSCIGFCVGLGNIWRFPYLCYQNGGGAFLIPYAIMLIIAGIPLYYFELILGQFANLGPISVWRVSPLFKGVGIAMVIISFLVCIYYNVIIGWTFYYLFASFTNSLPWKECENSWNDASCRIRGDGIKNNLTQNVEGNTRYWNKFPADCTESNNVECTTYQTPSEQYFERVVLGMTSYDGVTRTMEDGIGLPQWHVTLCLLLGWLVVFFCLIKGIKSSGKVVYFTAIFPYVVLIILFIRGITLEGAYDGIKFYITPEWNRLSDAKVWADAAVQIFYSLGIGFGGLLTMASYNKFKNNCFRDAMIVSILNCCTSVFAGFAIFSVLGYMAHKTGVEISKVAKAGPGLAFVAYPEGIAAMPISPLWAILFFLMVLTLGLDSQFAMMETVITGVMDEFPILKKSEPRRIGFILFLCLGMFLLGLPMCCKAGIYLFTLVDWYSASFSLFFVGIVEVCAISYVYGIKNFLKDAKMMLGFYPGPYWIGCWMFVSPVAVLFIFIFKMIKYTKAYYGTYFFPDWMEALGWLMVLSSFIFIPLFVLIEHCRRGGWQAWKNAARPTEDWGPCVHKYWKDDPRYAQKLEEQNKETSFSFGQTNKGYENTTGVYMDSSDRQIF